MKILHTADWHLGDRLGRIDRTADLCRAVERVADYCREYQVDVLLIAGDLFSELARPDGLREAIRHVQETYGSFLQGGGTILALTGNHDNENFCQTLYHAMKLAVPEVGQTGGLAAPGRFYLAHQPTFFRLADRANSGEVQFVLMPYPTPTRYLEREETQRYHNLEEKNRHLQQAYIAALRAIRQQNEFNPQLPTVLGAHIHVRGSQVASLFRLSEEEDVLVESQDLSSGFTYVALGHIHKAQTVAGHEHIRYTGSIERMDLGEAGDRKGVVLVEIGPEGLQGLPMFLPLESTPIYRVEVRRPQEELPGLTDQYPDAERALVYLALTYTAGVDSLEETLAELETIFPRWYAREWQETGALDSRINLGPAPPGKSFEDTVRDYLRSELVNYSVEEREELLARAEALLREKD